MSVGCLSSLVGSSVKNNIALTRLNERQITFARHVQLNSIIYLYVLAMQFVFFQEIKYEKLVLIKHLPVCLANIAWHRYDCLIHD